MTFEEWWEANKHMLPNIVKIDAREAFGAATKAEREACAKVCEEQSREMFRSDMTWECNGAATCASAIRARSNAG